MTEKHSHSFVEVAGCKTEVYRGGNGEALLFLHGAGGNLAWTPFMEKLARNFEVIAPSHPGFGRSDMPDWLDQMDDAAYFYLDFLETLDLSGVHLVGSSLGGWLAAEIAVRSQARLKSLTLVSAAGILVPEEPMGDIFIWSAEEAVRNLFHDQKLADARLADQLDEEVQEMMLRNRFATARLGWQPRMHNPVLRKWMHRITLPTVILWGEQDKIFPPVYARAYKDLIPHAELRTLPECGHLPQFEKTDEFVDAVIAAAKMAA